MENIIIFFVKYKSIVTVIHVVGVVFGMGAALMSDLLFSFYGHDKKLTRFEISTLSILSNAVWAGLVLIILSGFGLFLSDVVGYMVSTKFLIKMTIMLVLLVNGFVLHRYISKLMQKRGFLSSGKYSGVRKLAFICGAVSVVSWLGVCLLGVMDKVYWSYTSLITAYIICIVISIICALVVEQITFEKSKRK